MAHNDCKYIVAVRRDFLWGDKDAFSENERLRLATVLEGQGGHWDFDECPKPDQYHRIGYKFKRLCDAQHAASILLGQGYHLARQAKGKLWCVSVSVYKRD